MWLLIAACMDKHPQHRPSANDLASLLREIAPTVEATPQWVVRADGGAPPLLTQPSEHTQAIGSVPSTDLVLASQSALPPSTTLVTVAGANGEGAYAGAAANSPSRVFTTPRRTELAAVVVVIVLAFAATWLFSSIGSAPPVKATFAAVPTQQPSSTPSALSDGGPFGTGSPSGTATASASASATASAGASASPSGAVASPTSGSQPGPSQSAGPPLPSPSPSQRGGGGGGGGGGGITNGWVDIVNATSGLLLDSGGNVPAWSRLKQWDFSPSPNVQWEIVSVRNGYFRIVNRTNGMVVDSGGSTSDGATATQSPWSGSDDQLWWFNNVGGGRYQIINRATGMALDGGGDTQAGSSVILWQPNRNTNNEWTINGA
jgi:hypothetical protein